jgi:hypothetical protein
MVNSVGSSVVVWYITNNNHSWYYHGVEFSIINYTTFWGGQYALHHIIPHIIANITAQTVYFPPEPQPPLSSLTLPSPAKYQSLNQLLDQLQHLKSVRTYN